MAKLINTVRGTNVTMSSKKENILSRKETLSQLVAQGRVTDASETNREDAIDEYDLEYRFSIISQHNQSLDGTIGEVFSTGVRNFLRLTGSESVFTEDLSEFGGGTGSEDVLGTNMIYNRSAILRFDITALSKIDRVKAGRKLKALDLGIQKLQDYYFSLIPEAIGEEVFVNEQAKYQAFLRLKKDYKMRVDNQSAFTLANEALERRRLTPASLELCSTAGLLKNIGTDGKFSESDLAKLRPFKDEPTLAAKRGKLIGPREIPVIGSSVLSNSSAPVHVKMSHAILEVMVKAVEKGMTLFDYSTEIETLMGTIIIPHATAIPRISEVKILEFYKSGEEAILGSGVKIMTLEEVQKELGGK